MFIFLKGALTLAGLMISILIIAYLFVTFKDWFPLAFVFCIASWFLGRWLYGD